MGAQRIGGQESRKGPTEVPRTLEGARNPPEERWIEEDAHRNPPRVLEDRNLLEHLWGKMPIGEVVEVGYFGTQRGGRSHLTASRAGSQVPGRTRTSRELPYPQSWSAPSLTPLTLTHPSP